MAFPFLKSFVEIISILLGVNRLISEYVDKRISYWVTVKVTMPVSFRGYGYVSRKTRVSEHPRGQAYPEECRAFPGLKYPKFLLNFRVRLPTGQAEYQNEISDGQNVRLNLNSDIWPSPSDALII